jgi:hypothetical protein
MTENAASAPVVKTKPTKNRKGCVISLVIIVVILLICSVSWVAVRPGVFSIQPIGAIPFKKCRNAVFLVS